MNANTPYAEDLVSAVERKSMYAYLQIKLTNTVDALEQNQDLEMCHPLVHQLVGVLFQMLSNGIDQSVSMQASPLKQNPAGDEIKGCYSIFAQIMHSRRTVKFITTLQFLKHDKMRAPIFLLLEIASNSLVELFTQPLLNEIILKYNSQALMRTHLGKIIDAIDALHAKAIHIHGPIIDRYAKFIEIAPINFQEEESKVPQAPIHKLKDTQTPDGFGSPLCQIGFKQDHVQEEEAEQSTVEHFKGVTNFKKSQFLYLRYEQYTENFEYKLFLSKPQRRSLKDQSYRCITCRCLIDDPWFRKPTAFECMMSGYWFCEKCMAPQSMIPWKIITNFDFKEYPISAYCSEIIEQILHKPIVTIEYIDDIIYKNEVLYDALIFKRQLHLLYDTICQEYIFDRHYILGDHRKNLLLSTNLFCLQDLIEIHKGTLNIILKSIYQECLKHIYDCKECLKNPNFCSICYKVNQYNQPIFTFDILNTNYCRVCKRLYHRICFPKKCICQSNF